MENITWGIFTYAFFILSSATASWYKKEMEIKYPPVRPSVRCFLSFLTLFFHLAQVRAGATLLFDSDPAMEEAETELKASAMIDAIVRSDPGPGDPGAEVCCHLDERNGQDIFYSSNFL